MQKLENAIISIRPSACIRLLADINAEEERGVPLVAGRGLKGKGAEGKGKESFKKGKRDKEI